MATVDWTLLEIHPVDFDAGENEAVAQCQGLYDKTRDVLRHFKEEEAHAKATFLPQVVPMKVLAVASLSRGELNAIEAALRGISERREKRIEELRVSPPAPNDIAEALRAREVRDFVLREPEHLRRRQMLLTAVGEGDITTFNAIVGAPPILQAAILGPDWEAYSLKMRDEWTKLRNPQINAALRKIGDAIELVERGLNAAKTYINNAVRSVEPREAMKNLEEDMRARLVRT
jgi:hypothetical protein